MSFSLSQLTEGIQARNVGIGNRRLLEKWGRTGLLRGLEGVKRENMATMLENQAGQALREASNLGAGSAGGTDIRGFTNIAFPIVRRVFGGLIANELVSIQPMSLPSGLLFYLDYTYGNSQGGDLGTDNASYVKGESIYGSPTNPKAGSPSLAVGGQYDLAGSGFSKRDAELAIAAVAGVIPASAVFIPGTAASTDLTIVLTADHASWVSHDPQVLADIGQYVLCTVPVAKIPTADLTLVQEIALAPGTAFSGLIAVPDSVQGGAVLNVRRLNRRVNWTDKDSALDLAPADGTHILMVLRRTSPLADLVGADWANPHHGVIGFVQKAGEDSTDFSTVVSPAFESAMDAYASDIPEIDIKIESVSVVAQTRKLRAKWSPELAQDLNAYHSLDAEVELTQILSEQVALEIDREILGDLLTGAEAANYFWSRSPGNFVNKRTGVAVSRASSLRPGPAFTGTVREWYETLIETIIDVANEIHRRTLRGAANFIVVSPEIATVLEASVLYKPVLSLDSDGQVAGPMTIGAEAVGTLWRQVMSTLRTYR
jgi:hypothetical protein